MSTEPTKERVLTDLLTEILMNNPMLSLALDAMALTILKFVEDNYGALVSLIEYEKGTQYKLVSDSVLLDYDEILDPDTWLPQSDALNTLITSLEELGGIVAGSLKVTLQDAPDMGTMAIRLVIIALTTKED